MVLYVVNQLLDTKRVHLIKVDAARIWLPLEVVQFVEVWGLLPPVLSYLHTPLDQLLRIVTRQNSVLELGDRLVPK